VFNLAGRHFSLSGRVTGGAGRGLELGFPTANLNIPPQQALPADGVYATWTHIDGKTYQSMTNVGKQPTFGNNRRTVEVYILDYQSDLYGHELKIDIMAKVRSEQRFGCADELKKQITEDIKQGRAILDSRDGN
jgi:riboflavin kinase/FMN adenylyltransferase